jgi:hypothetical protein
VAGCGFRTTVGIRRRIYSPYGGVASCCLLSRRWALTWMTVRSLRKLSSVGAEVVTRSFAKTIGLTTDDDAGLVYVSILGGEIRMVLMGHDCPVAQLTDATTITHKSVALQ